MLSKINEYFGKVFKTKKREEVEFILVVENDNLTITNNGRTITCIYRIFTMYDFGESCFLNLEMSKDIHHFIFSIENCNKEVVIGCSHYFNEIAFTSLITSCSIRVGDNTSTLFGPIGKKIEKEEIPLNIKAKEHFEVIFNMNERTMSISTYYGKEILLFTDIKYSPVYPFVILQEMNDSVTLIKYWKE